MYTWFFFKYLPLFNVINSQIIIWAWKKWKSRLRVCQSVLPSVTETSVYSARTIIGFRHRATFIWPEAQRSIVRKREGSDHTGR